MHVISCPFPSHWGDLFERQQYARRRLEKACRRWVTNTMKRLEVVMPVHHRLRDDVFLGGGSSLPESSRSMTLLASSSESAAFLLREGAALLVALDPEREGAKLSWDWEGAAAFLAGAFRVAGAFLAGAFFFGASDDAESDSSDS